MSTFSVVSSVVAIKVGILVSSFLFGAATIQAFFYYSNYPKDPMHIKIFSAVVWGLELFGMIFSTHLLYSAAVEPYLNAPILMFLNPPYQILATILVGNWSGIVVQIYFLDRVRRFTKQIWPIIPCILLILYTFASTIPVIVICGTRGLAEFTLNWRWLSISGMFVSAFIDLFLAGMLCWNLALQRRSAFTRSATMIDRIIVMTLTTGLITSVVAVLAAVLSIALPYELIYLGVYICLARVYANSYFAALNSRNVLRNGTDETSIESFRLSLRSRTGQRGHSSPSADLRGARIAPVVKVAYEEQFHEIEMKTFSGDSS